MEGDRVIRIRPDREHRVTGGFACPKGLHQHEMYGSPDRVTQPLKREGAVWREVSWARAIREIGEQIRRLRRVHGPDAIAAYAGTAAGFSLLHPIVQAGFLQGLGSRNQFSSATQDCSNKFAVAKALYGFPFLQPFPDVDHTECLIVVGANPVISKMSFLHLPRSGHRLQAIRDRGGRVVFVDPRRTESAQRCGEHLPIRPGTDVFFYLSFLHHLVQEGGVDRDRVARHTTGAVHLERLAASWPAERTAAVTGIAPQRLLDLVRAYLAADGAALYCSTGVNMGPHGALAFWLQEGINALSGNLDRRGGTLVGRGLFDFAGLGRRFGIMTSTARSRVGDLPAVADCLPGGLLPDEILTPGPGQVRALFVSGGNPLLTMANGARLRDALGRLELLVTVDLFRTETAELGHYLLPATSPLERPDLLFLFPLLMGQQATPYLQATEAVIPPPGQVREELDIYLDLARACGAPLFGSRLAQGLLRAGRALGRRPGPLRHLRVDSRRLLSGILRAGGAGDFDALVQEPHGRLLPPSAPGTFLGTRVPTADGRVHLAPRPLRDAASGLEAAFAAERRASGLRLITRRAVRTHNSWTHNLPAFVAPERGRHENHVYLHPRDAAERGLAEGDLADVTSATGRVRLPVRLCEDLVPGAVALPHGWGHQGAPGLRTASRTAGVNANLLAADGRRGVDPFSGMVQLTAIDVEVRPAAGPRNPASWSGL